MPLQRLQVDGVRCLRGIKAELDPERNVVVGPNGAGKTSLLESIHLLARGRSFRTRQTRRLVRRGDAAFSVFGELGDEAGAHDRIGVAFAPGGLRIQVNGRPAEGMADLAQLLVVHVVDPSAHGLVEGGPMTRRRFLDAGVFHVEHGYLAAWRQYRRVLGQRNAALKGGARGAELASWTEQLLTVGAMIDAARRRYVGALAGALAPIGRRLLGLEIELEYRPGWRRGMALDEALRESDARDRDAGFTQVGPHRADLAIRMGGDRIEAQASRGQQKLVAAGLVVAEAASLCEAGLRKGVLLIDDPAAELDADALSRLVGEIDRVPVQRVFTALEADPLTAGGGRMFHVEQGHLHRVL